MKIEINFKSTENEHYIKNLEDKIPSILYRNGYNPETFDIKIVKDNPVPSLDKQFAKEDMCQFGLFLGNNFKKNQNKDIDQLLNEFLQNGVETDKEEPKIMYTNVNNVY